MVAGAGCGWRWLWACGWPHWLAVQLLEKDKAEAHARELAKIEVCCGWRWWRGRWSVWTRAWQGRRRKFERRERRRAEKALRLEQEAKEKVIDGSWHRCHRRRRWW